MWHDYRAASTVRSPWSLPALSRMRVRRPNLPRGARAFPGRGRRTPPHAACNSSLVTSNSVTCVYRQFRRIEGSRRPWANAAGNGLRSARAHSSTLRTAARQENPRLSTRLWHDFVVGGRNEFFDRSNVQTGAANGVGLSREWGSGLKAGLLRANGNPVCHALAPIARRRSYHSSASPFQA